MATNRYEALIKCEILALPRVLAWRRILES